MKLFIVLALAICGTSASLSRFFIEEKWADFKLKHNRNYLNAKEEAFRKQIFQNNLRKIEEHNAKFHKGEVTWKMGVNKFTDKTEEEIKNYNNGLIESKKISKPLIEIRSRVDLGLNDSVQIPASVDWREKGVVTPVKDQGNCGSCWAFSTTGAIESQEKIANGADLESSLSEQQLVDCDPYAYGCNGGWMTDAYDYIAQNGGLDSESAYPYEADDGNCRYKSENVAAKLKGYASLESPDEKLLAEMVANQGPISVAFDAEGALFSYSEGIYVDDTCSTNSFTHAVLIVGYGSENGQDYWIVKNSWGDSWGENGYFKMARNNNNMCGIASKASYPVLA